MRDLNRLLWRTSYEFLCLEIYIYTYIHIYIYLYQIYCFIHIYVFATTTTIASLVMLLTHWDRDKIIVISQTTLYPNHAIWRPRNWSALAQILVWCLMALSWLSPKSCVIHVRTISQEMLGITVFDICCETTNSRLLYHTWVWNRGICMCVIVRPRSHMLIVLKKVIPDTTRYDFA